MPKITPEQLAAIPLLCGLSPTDLAAVAKQLHPRDYPTGTVILSEEQPGEAVYLIVEGTVKIAVLLPDGDQILLAILGTGEIVGELGVLQGLGRSASATTLERSTLLWIGRDQFQAALYTMPVMAQNLVHIAPACATAVLPHTTQRLSTVYVFSLLDMVSEGGILLYT